MLSLKEKPNKKGKDAELVEQVVLASSPATEDEEFFPDGGLRAWLVVVGCFIVSAFTGGFCFVWGVFQPFYAEGILAGTSPSTLSLLGSIPGALMTMLSVVTGKLADRYQYKPMIGIGCILWIITLLGIAFSTKLWHFVLIQGVMQGIAGGFTFPTCASLPSQWFYKRRGFSTGIVSSGGAFGAAITSVTMGAMLPKFGLRKTMLIKAGMDAILLGIAYLLIQERRKPTTRITWYDKRYLTDPTFWSITLCVCLANFGYPAPYFYLPTFAKQNIPNLSEMLSALTVTILTISSGVGRCCAGLLADKIGPTNAMFLFILVAGLVQLLVWNFVTNYAGILAMSVLYGFVGVCFWALVTPVAGWFYGIENLAGLSGLLFFFAAPGELIGPPITGAIYNATKNWHWVTAFSGTVQIVGAITLLYARFKREPSIFKVY